jgi:hypothetical protein
MGIRRTTTRRPVALALAVAESTPPGRLARDLVIALYDAEEPPHFLSPTMGSIRFYEDQRRQVPFHAAIVMDLIGHAVRFGDQLGGRRRCWTARVRHERQEPPRNAGRAPLCVGIARRTRVAAPSYRGA